MDYPELEEELERIKDYYMREENAHRRGVPLRLETWRKVQIHMLSECICVHMCLSWTVLLSNAECEWYCHSPFTVIVYWKYVVSRGDTPCVESFLDEDVMEAFLAYIKVWLS